MRPHRTPLQSFSQGGGLVVRCGQILKVLEGFPSRWVMGDEERGVKGTPRIGAGATGWIVMPFLEMARTGDLN